MTKPVIAIDIDDVLADNAAGFVAFSNQRWGTTLKPEDYDEHWSKLWQVDHEEVERRAAEWGKSGMLKQYAHDDSALPVLQQLSQSYNLIVVTSRRLDMKVDTLEWVYRHYPGVFSDETVHFAGIWDTVDKDSHTKTKADVVESLGADYLIDDQLKHVLAVAQTGRKAILFGNYTWNQTDSLPAGVVRIEDWHAVGEYFKHETGR